eukprot:4842894-Amphidinium_carterae.1
MLDKLAMIALGFRVFKELKGSIWVLELRGSRPFKALDKKYSHVRVIASKVCMAFMPKFWEERAYVSLATAA